MIQSGKNRLELSCQRDSNTGLSQHEVEFGPSDRTAQELDPKVLLASFPRDIQLRNLKSES